MMFDMGMLKSHTFPLPVICVGNLTVGGTGKTPHTEYLIRLLSHNFQVAVLSRGYKRKSKGFVLGNNDTKVREIGDEPYQMKHKFPHIHMAVDKNRCHGIGKLTRSDIQPPVEVIILDDAFQHRRVKAGLNILLMDYHRLVYLDKLLPAGRLREPISGMRRADIILVTKCPRHITPMEQRGIERTLSPDYWQKIFFTTYSYPSTMADVGEKPLLVTGIASPEQMAYDLRHIIPDFELMAFPDHYNFKESDIERIRTQAAGRTILTTEKDATRLHGLEHVVTIPIEVEFIDGKQNEFNQLIEDYVQNNLHHKKQNNGHGNIHNR